VPTTHALVTQHPQVSFCRAAANVAIGDEQLTLNESMRLRGAENFQNTGRTILVLQRLRQETSPVVSWQVFDE